MRYREILDMVWRRVEDRGLVEGIDDLAGYGRGTLRRWVSGSNGASLAGIIDYAEAVGLHFSISGEDDSVIPRFLKTRR